MEKQRQETEMKLYWINCKYFDVLCSLVLTVNVCVCVCVCVTEITSVCWKDPSGCGMQVYEAFGGELEVGKASLRAGRVTSWWVSGMWQVLGDGTL